MPDSLLRINVKGLDEVQNMLAHLPALVVLHAFDRALGAAGAVLEQSMVAEAPLGREFEEGLLKDNTVIDVQVDPKGRGGTVKVGYDHSVVSDRNDVPADVLAHWIEFGHWWTTHSHLAAGGLFQAGKRRIKFIPGQHFMAVAAEAASDQAIGAFADVLADVLDSGVLMQGYGGVAIITPNTIASTSTQDFLEGIHEF